MKKFKLTILIPREFTIPDSATDEEYDAMKNCILEDFRGLDKDAIVKVELVDAPPEVKEKYIINKDCQD